MDEELNLDNTEEITRKDSRIKSLSDKVKTTSEERDAEKARADKAEAERVAALKDAEFFKNFNTASAKYPGSNEYQDKIRENVALGLSVEDATMFVMAKEGKYTPPAPVIERQSAAGGSASIGMADTPDKKPSEMKRDELRSKLMEVESRGEKLI